MLQYNAFRVMGDFSHLMSFVFLLMTMFKKKSAKGISLKSQQLYLIVFVSRYLDVFHFSHSLTYGQLYNTTFKIVYISLTSMNIYLIMFKNPWKESYATHTKNGDTLNILYVIVPALIMGLLTSSRWSGVSGLLEVRRVARDVCLRLLLLHLPFVPLSLTEHCSALTHTLPLRRCGRSPSGSKR
jgi:hypothetical protein